MDADLARALVADPRWRWAEGMCGTTSEGAAIVVAVGLRGIPVRWVVRGEPGGGRYAEDEDEALAWWWRDALPDLDHPATAGAVASMLAAECAKMEIDTTNGVKIWFTLRTPVQESLHFRAGDTTLGRAAARAWLSIKERA